MSFFSKVCGITALMLCGIANAQVIAPEQAQDYVGRFATVCGKIAQIADKGDYVFINLTRPFPNHNFYYFYPKNNFARNEIVNSKACVTGIVEQKTGKTPQIKVSEQGQIQVVR